MTRGLGMGVLGALALLAACSPRNTEPEDAGAGSEDGADEGAETACSFDDYYEEQGPYAKPFAEMGCLYPIGGNCKCDEDCQKAILGECDGGEFCYNPDLCVSLGGCVDIEVVCFEKIGDECCYWVVANVGEPPIPGRPLRRSGVPVLPELRVVGEQRQAASTSSAAAAYREFARFERASVAAFVDAAVLLRGLGAPSALVDAHERAADEEARHAVLALAAAEALDGRLAVLADDVDVTLREVATEVSQARLEQFLVDLVHDGCIGEHLAASEASWSAQRVTAPALAAYWRPLVTEEASHAALAWATLEWLLDTFPTLRPLAEQQLARSLLAFEGNETPSEAEPSSVGPLGLPSTTDRSAIHTAALAELHAAARGQLAAA